VLTRYRPVRLLRICYRPMGSCGLVTDLLRGNRCNGFWPFSRHYNVTDIQLGHMITPLTHQCMYTVITQVITPRSCTNQAFK